MTTLDPATVDARLAPLLAGRSIRLSARDKALKAEAKRLGLRIVDVRRENKFFKIGGPWGNPEVVKKELRGDPKAQREAVEKFARETLPILVARPDFASLKGAALLCSCPTGVPCHADVLAEAANAESSEWT